MLLALVMLVVVAGGSPARSAALGPYHYCLAELKIPISPTSCTMWSSRSVVRWNVPAEIAPGWSVSVDGNVVACSNFYVCPKWLPTGKVSVTPSPHRVDLIMFSVIGGCGLCLFYGGYGEVQDV